jgi:hypothetical protein
MNEWVQVLTAVSKKLSETEAAAQTITITIRSFDKMFFDLADMNVKLDLGGIACTFLNSIKAETPLLVKEKLQLMKLLIDGRVRVRLTLPSFPPSFRPLFIA